MASYTKTTPTSLADELVCIVSTSTSADDNITGSTSGTLYLVEVDNTLNENTGIYLNIAEASSATSGTTVPDFRLYVSAGKKSTFTWSEGHNYSSGLSAWVTSSNVYTELSGPSNNVIIKILVTA
tara:strand:+ start:1262 stop:1636 length:375 start_codon:yes stop_codon:yes gene_type:complete